MPLDLNLVSVFARVVDAGSFTAAARALRRPKSSVSRAVSRLEDGLGARLLHRTSRALALTPAGERYLAEVRGPLARLAEAAAEVSTGSAAPRGLVRMSIAPGMTEIGLAGVLAQFSRRHPGIHVELLVTNRHVDLVGEGIDLALRAGRLRDSALIARRVAGSDLYLFAAPSYLRRRGRPRRLQDLAAHDCVVFRSPTGAMPWRLTGPGGAEEVQPIGLVSADDFMSIASLAAEVLGVALLPAQLGRAHLERGSLERVLPDHAIRGPAMFLVSPPARHVPARVGLLRTFLLAELGAVLGGARRASPRDPAGGAPAPVG